MYSTCIFCHGSLGRNEAVEAFPVGRRLAFDAEKGRLWVVCPGCARWNLTPLESRWEAIEECEKLFRDSRLRASTRQVGLARVREGTVLVRIGNPLRPEMAAWRYGDRFGRRRRKYFVVTAATALGVGAVTIGGPMAGVLSWGVGINLAQLFLTRSGRAKLPIGERVFTLSALHLMSIMVRPSVGAGFVLEIPHRYPGGFRERFRKFGLTAPNDSDVRLTLRGDDAVRAARHLLPHINRSAGKSADVQHALGVLERGRSVDDLFSAAAHTPREELSYWTRPSRDAYPKKQPSVVLNSLSAPVRLALEMSIHEDDERRALEGELAELEERWREAEEVAAIADDLFLPQAVRSAIARLRGQP